MRVVVDTNVIVSAILFKKGRLDWLRDTWTHGEITPLVNKPCTDELLRVLSYPKFQLGAGEIETLLGAYLPYAEIVSATAGVDGLPRCRDRDDQKFLALSQAGKAQVLITGDKALLALAGRTRFAIEAPNTFRRRINA